MLDAIFAVVVCVLEWAASCHCASWRQMPGGYSRCAVIAHRCELVEGPHWIQVGEVAICTRRCGDGTP